MKSKSLSLVDKIFLGGRHCFDIGKTLQQNPFNSLAKYEFHVMWEKGWNYQKSLKTALDKHSVCR